MEKQEKRRWAVAAALSLTVLGACLYNASSQNLPRVGEVKIKPEIATVYVSGAVKHPGLVRLEEGGRFADALEAAGGATANADLGKVNLAQAVKDGQQIVVPSALQQEEALNGGEGKININSANKEELDKLPGVGPAMAEKIIEYRKTHGSYQNITDLKKVKGMGEAKFNKLKDKLAI